MTAHQGPTAPRFVQLIQGIFSPLTFRAKNVKRYGESYEINWEQVSLRIHTINAVVNC